MARKGLRALSGSVHGSRGGSDGPEAVEASRRPFDGRERGRGPGRATAGLRVSGPVGPGREPAALRMGKDARVEARPRKVRPVRGPGGGLVRLRRPPVGGRRQQGAEHPADVPTLRPPRGGRVEVEKKTRGLGHGQPWDQNVFGFHGILRSVAIRAIPLDRDHVAVERAPRAAPGGACANTACHARAPDPPRDGVPDARGGQSNIEKAAPWRGNRR
jgi:hypothetical protein